MIHVRSNDFLEIQFCRGASYCTGYVLPLASSRCLNNQSITAPVDWLDFHISNHWCETLRILGLKWIFRSHEPKTSFQRLQGHVQLRPLRSIASPYVWDGSIRKQRSLPTSMPTMYVLRQVPLDYGDCTFVFKFMYLVASFGVGKLQVSCSTLSTCTTYKLTWKT